jgi:hypothetical protein
MLKNLQYIGAVIENIRNWLPFLLAYSRVRAIRLEYHNQALSHKDYDIGVLLKFLQKKGFRIIKSREDSAWAGIVWLERVVS